MVADVVASGVVVAGAFVVAGVVVVVGVSVVTGVVLVVFIDAAVATRCVVLGVVGLGQRGSRDP